jgi:hypothetical protein
MARRRRKRYGDPTDYHADRAKGTLREINRLRGALKRHLKAPPDCATAAHLAISLAQAQGSYLIDRSASGPRISGSYGGKGPRAVIERFIRACVIEPRSLAAKRKIHAVWR